MFFFLTFHHKWSSGSDWPGLFVFYCCVFPNTSQQSNFRILFYFIFHFHVRWSDGIRCCSDWPGLVFSCCQLTELRQY